MKASPSAMNIPGPILDLQELVWPETLGMASEKEVEQAFEKERKRKKLMLFPVQLDDTVKRTRQAWAADLRRIRHIGDFRQWKDHDE